MTYLDDIGAEIAAELDADQLPDGDLSGLLRIYALLVCAKGEQATAEDVHNAWSAWMAGIDPDHESLRPFNDLDLATRKEDVPFLTAVKAVAAHRGKKGTMP